MTDRARSSPWGALALGLVLVGLAVWLVANSALFAARDIKVLGNVRLTATEVQRLAGISIGDNVLRLGTDEAVRSLQRSPWVARASVERSLPSTVVVHVLERSAAGWLRDRGGPVLVAADGTVLQRAEKKPADIPFVGRWGTTLEPGQRVVASRVLRVAGKLPAELAPSVLAVSVDGDELVLDLRGGAEARYGDASALEAKNGALVSVLRWARERELEVGIVDLRIPSAPSLRPLPSRS
jgi:cell division protein FtsQ